MRAELVFAFLLAAAAPASAHVTLAQPSAKAGSHSVVTFQVGHGCADSPTTALRIEIPENVTLANPQPKSGWALTIDHTAKHVSAITWSGGSLPADEFDEFAVMMKLPANAETVTFPTTQTCAKGAEHWTEAKGSTHPAPMLTLTPAGMPDSMPGMDIGTKP
ncbi:MAG TPA: YcnI family protein [Rhizomicrobium sp.]|jgi:hypothetical protein